MFVHKEKKVSQVGEKFPPDTKVSFVIKNEQEFGTVIKQNINSAVVEINETQDNHTLVFQTQGTIVISYKELKTV